MRNRGEVWLADLDPKRSTEPGKPRPVLIVQAQALLDAQHPSTLIIPLTTVLVEGAEPSRIRVPAAERLRRTSDLLIDQLRAIDNRRLVKGPLTKLSVPLMKRIHEAIIEVLDLDQDRNLLGSGGKLCFHGFRLTLYDVLEYLASGMSEVESLKGFSDVTGGDIRICLAFTADGERKPVSIPRS